MAIKNYGTKPALQECIKTIKNTYEDIRKDKDYELMVNFLKLSIYPSFMNVDFEDKNKIKRLVNKVLIMDEDKLTKTEKELKVYLTKNNDDYYKVVSLCDKLASIVRLAPSTRKAVETIQSLGININPYLDKVNKDTSLVKDEIKNIVDEFDGGLYL